MNNKDLQGILDIAGYSVRQACDMKEDNTPLFRLRAAAHPERPVDLELPPEITARLQAFEVPPEITARLQDLETQAADGAWALCRGPGLPAAAVGLLNHPLQGVGAFLGIAQAGSPTAFRDEMLARQKLDRIDEIPARPLPVQIVPSPAARPQQAQPHRGGRPATAIPADVQLDALAWLGAEGEPEALVVVERKIAELLAAGGHEASEATIRRCARKLIDRHRKALGT